MNEIEEYGDPGIASSDAPVPGWLKWTYIVLPIWGIICFYFFWNGSIGLFENGPWGQLQQAANTKYPFENITYPEQSLEAKAEVKAEVKGHHSNSNRLERLKN